MNKQNGFTIVELMIVVAIIGILAALAGPLYTDYLQRAKVSDAVYLLAGYKHTAVEFYYFKGHWPASLSSVGGKTRGRYTSVLTTGGDPDTGIYWVEATLAGDVSLGGIYGRQVRLYYDSNTLEWECSLDGVDDDGDGGQPIPGHLAPGSCR